MMLERMADETANRVFKEINEKEGNNESPDQPKGREVKYELCNQINLSTHPSVKQGSKYCPMVVDRTRMR